MSVPETFKLTAQAVGWYKRPRDRVEEVQLKDRFVEADSLEGLFAAVRRTALRTLTKLAGNCEALRLTVMFRMDDGVEAKVSYLAERGAT